MKKLFTNVAVVEASREAVMGVISNADRLIEWDTDIALVEKNEAAGSYHITRQGAALNPEETLAVGMPDDHTVVYSSTGGRLEYEVTFDVSPQGERTRVEETLAVHKDADSHLPLTLLTPIAKHAFNVMLMNLGRVIEVAK